MGQRGGPACGSTDRLAFGNRRLVPPPQSLAKAQNARRHCRSACQHDLEFAVSRGHCRRCVAAPPSCISGLSGATFKRLLRARVVSGFTWRDRDACPHFDVLQRGFVDHFVFRDLARCLQHVFNVPVHHHRPGTNRRECA